MTASATTPRLSKRQAELMLRVALRRYVVRFTHYMGSFSPNESVYVDEHEMVDGERGKWLRSERQFRPATAHALRERGLLRFQSQGVGSSVLRPTSDGLEWLRSDQAAALIQEMRS